MKPKFSISVTQEMNNKLDHWSSRLGISKSALISMAINAGMDTLIRAVAPAESLSSADWEKIIAAGEKNNVKIEVPGVNVEKAD